MKMVYIRSCVWLLVLSLVVPAGGFAQDAGPEPPVFRQEELDQMLAPIALYPDPLLVQVLMAATYPLEVVQAARWINQNPSLKDNSLAVALEEKNWDPSVKSLVNFPPVLTMMNDKLEWTQNLGDAFLGQKDQVMATVQTLRAKAQAQGALKTTPQQMVVLEEETILIEPTNPQVVYVPVYNPIEVYGPWWYPAYPPYYYHPHGYAVRSGFVTFGAGMALGAAWGYAWGRPNWTSRHVYVNPSQNISINRYYHAHARQNNRYISGHDNREWRHDPIHRKGVEYRDPGLHQRFGHGAPPAGANPGKYFRGFAPTGGQHQMQKPGAAPGFEQHRNTGAPVNHPPPQNTNGAVQHDRSTTPQNRPAGTFNHLNRGGNDMNPHRVRGHMNRESTPAPQIPAQAIQGGKPAQAGGGGHPNAGGGHNPGGGGANTGKRGGNQGPGSGDNTPSTGGGHRQQ